MRTVAVSGEETGVSFGFPLSWHAPSAASSMQTNVALVPMFVDFLVYFGLTHAFCHFAQRRVTIKKYVIILSVVLLWLAAILSLTLCIFVAATHGGEIYIFKLSDYFDGHGVRSRSVAFGLLPRY